MRVRRTTISLLALASLSVAVLLVVWQRRSNPPLASETLASASKANATDGNPSVAHRSDDPARVTTQLTALSNAFLPALEAIEAESDPQRQAAALAKLSEELPLTSVPTALAALAGKTSRAHSELRQMLVRRWTKSDAPSAADWIERNISGPARSDALGAVASTWAESDAAGAEQWARRLMDVDERGSALLAIATEMTRDDPLAALSLGVELPPSQGRDEFLSYAAGEWAGHDPKSAIEWGKQIQDAELRAQMLAAIATGFAEENPSAAATLAAQSIPAGRAQDDAVVSIVQRWVQQEPEQAAAWVAAFPEGKLRDTALEAVVKLWADKDITDAGAWVNQLTARDGSDVAIAAYVEKVAVQFPEMAAEWVQEIRDPRLRDERMINLAELWLHNDAEAARKWIAQAPLAEETKSRLLAPPKK
jgi:hypothetical protein